MAGTRGSVGRKRELSRPRGLLGGDARSLVQKLFWWQAKISFSGRPGSPRSRTANRSLAAARLILFVLAAAVVLTVTLISAAPVALADGPSVGVTLNPPTASITAGGSQVYQAKPYLNNLQEADGSSYGSVEVTGITITIADGTCTPSPRAGISSCGATTAGTHPVTATVTYSYQVGYTTATGTATATVPLDVEHGPPVSLALNPSSGTIIAGENSQPPYQAIGTDAYGNTFDATDSTGFTITPDGSCTSDGPKTCSATKAGTHTVTGTYNPGGGVTVTPDNGAVTGTASLDVEHGPPVSLALNPSSGSIIAGENSQPPYQAIGTDAYGNTFDATDSTGFTITPDGSCTSDGPKTCTASKATPHTVTGTYNLGNGATVTGTASLAVEPGPPASLTLTPSSATIRAGDSQAYKATGTDANGNTFDATDSTDFTITPDGSCTHTGPKTCTATKASPHTVTGTYDLGNGATVTGTASLNVKHGHPTSLTLTPGSAIIRAGENSKPYHATGTDAYGNPVGDLTSSTDFTIALNGSCTHTEPKTCT